MSHDRNCDVLQLVDRLAASADLVQTLNRHPSWNRGQRRLSYTGKEGVDHVNPMFFKGDVRVDQVFLNDAALAEPGVDLLCPHGGDRYPGVATDPDRSIIDNEEAGPAAAPLRTWNATGSFAP